MAQAGQSVGGGVGPFGCESHARVIGVLLSAYSRLTRDQTDFSDGLQIQLDSNTPAILDNQDTQALDNFFNNPDTSVPDAFFGNLNFPMDTKVSLTAHDRCFFARSAPL
jgi:hypothetical protein